MTVSTQHPWLRKTSALLGLWIVALSFLPLAFADSPRDNLKNDMEGRQQEVTSSFDDLSYRVDKIDPNDPRKNPPKGSDGKPLYAGAETLLDNAKNAKEALENLNADSEIVQNADQSYVPSQKFLDAESAAINAINAVSRFLVSPVQPGAQSLGKNGSVPGSGPKPATLIEDFIPQVIRLLFRFTSLAVLVSFVVSGVLFIIAFDNTEFTDKAKRMLYYSIIGFAFVTLAYAIVKGITNVNYFGII